MTKLLWKYTFSTRQETLFRLTSTISACGRCSTKALMSWCKEEDCFRFQIQLQRTSVLEIAFVTKWWVFRLLSLLHLLPHLSSRFSTVKKTRVPRRWASQVTEDSISPTLFQQRHECWSSVPTDAVATRVVHAEHFREVSRSHWLWTTSRVSATESSPPHTFLPGS